MFFCCCFTTLIIYVAVQFFAQQIETSDFEQLHSHLGPERCTSLLGFHAVTGCDQTGKFVGFTKKTCWKVLVDASPDVTSAFRSLGQCEISDKIKPGLEECVGSVLQG